MRLIKTTPQRATDGFNLVEALVALSVLGIGFGGLYTGLTQGYRLFGSVREQRRATQILVESTETLRLYTWDQIHDTNFLPQTFTRAFDPDNPSTSGVTYTGTVAVAGCPTTTESYRSNLCQVTFSLNWTSHGMSHQRQISSFVTSNGLYTYVTAAH